MADVCPSLEAQGTATLYPSVSSTANKNACPVLTLPTLFRTWPAYLILHDDMNLDASGHVNSAASC